MKTVNGGDELEEKEMEDDGPEEHSIGEEEQEELLKQWAASEIQASWRMYQGRLMRSDPQSTRHTPTSRKAVVHNHVTTGEGDICCACFTPISSVEQRLSESPFQLFCSSCKQELERGSRGVDRNGFATALASSVASPLPKLSILVQTEAKYQDQLKLLRQQQELLKQQQQEIEMRKKIQAETQQLAKQLARQRRRQFQQLMERRQAEEAQKIHEIVGVKEEEMETAKRRPKPNNAPPRERPRPSTHTDTPTVAIEPGQLRHHRIPAPPPSKREKDPASKAAEMAEKAALEHRRKQKLETMKCYAQDLTPLVHGQKPKKIPLPTTPPAATQNAKKAPQKPSKPSKIKLVPLQPPSKKDSSHIQSNNQSEPIKTRDDDGHDEVLRVQIPRRTNAYAMPTPLTAEIKPVSWMYELLSSDPVLSESKAYQTNHGTAITASSSILGTGPAASSMGMSHSRAQLTALMEEDDEQEHHVLPVQSLRSSFSGSGQRVTLAPLASTSVTSVAAAASTSAAPPKREYTSERLASLLEKYHVSVSTSIATTATTSKLES